MSACSNVVQEILKDVSYVILEPYVEGSSHTVYECFKNVYHISLKDKDNIHFIVNPDGGVEMHYNVESPKALNGKLGKNLKYLLVEK